MCTIFTQAQKNTQKKTTRKNNNDDTSFIIPIELRRITQSNTKNDNCYYDHIEN